MNSNLVSAAHSGIIETAMYLNRLSRTLGITGVPTVNYKVAIDGLNKYIKGAFNDDFGREMFLAAIGNEDIKVTRVERYPKEEYALFTIEIQKPYEKVTKTIRYPHGGY